MIAAAVGASPHAPARPISPPLPPQRHWQSFHVNWVGAIADALNDRRLPDGYFAERLVLERLPVPLSCRHGERPARRAELPRAAPRPPLVGKVTASPSSRRAPSR